MPGAEGRSVEAEAPEDVEAPPADSSWLEMETVRGGDVEPVESPEEQA